MAEIDIATLSPREWDIFQAGRESGYCHGIQHGREQMDAELAAAQRAAVASVRAAASMPPRDAEADRRRAERSAAWWAERRGEGGAA